MADQQPVQARSALGQILDIANGRHKWSRFIPLGLLALDAVLCVAVVLKVPCQCHLLLMPTHRRANWSTDTEIDWRAYMQQVEQFLGGQRDYAKISGDTGPLVYPAAHVYLYTALYYLTSEGRDIFVAQCIFAAIYLATVAVVMAVYRRGQASSTSPFLPVIETYSNMLPTGSSIHSTPSRSLEAPP